MRLTVIIPCYNEAATIAEVVARVRQAAPEAEIIAVDDGSTDGTAALLRDGIPGIQLLRHERNRGKGAAIATALPEASGEAILIQDADLEYDPADYPALLAPLASGEADAVYGSRAAGQGRKRFLNVWHYLGNRVLTALSNRLTGLSLGDVQTGYKAFRRDALDGIVLEERGFGFDPEITAKLARRGLRFREVPIAYRSRTYAEGKKIGWPDAFRAVYVMLRYGGRRK